MGTPISIDHELDPFTYVRDGFPRSLPRYVLSQDIAPEQWLELVSVELEIVKPHLKYLPGWKPLDDIVKDKREEPTLRPKYKNVNVRGSDLSQQVLSRRFLVPTREWSPIPTALLFLRRDGIWLQWDSQRVYDHGKYFEDDIVVEALDDRGLLDLLTYDEEHYRSTLGYAMISWLQGLIVKGIDERKNRLKELEMLQLRVGKPLTRVRRSG